VRTELSPRALLAHAKRIEAQMGRVEGPRWSPRPIDIDIALYDDEVIESDVLTVPHSRLGQRTFVLQPLLDIDPDLAHPQTGERLDSLLARLPAEGLTRIAGPEWASIKHESAG
jgi:2-amino-4-hydroxy-6-hydroxymethyldihydropteridine diphosphokinase